MDALAVGIDVANEQLDVPVAAPEPELFGVRRDTEATGFETIVAVARQLLAILDASLGGATRRRAQNARRPGRSCSSGDMGCVLDRRLG